MKKLALSLVCLSFLGCFKKKEDKHFPLIEKASWFLGDWENHAKEGHYTENWKKLSDSTFCGQSLITDGKDTVFHENAVLEQRNDSLFYDVSVNGEDETYFYLTKSNENEFVFENPKNSYPTKIIYKRITPDSILASIHGKIKGEEKSEFYPMRRQKK